MQRYDPESGQLYREIIVKAGSLRQREPEWERKCPVPKPMYRPPTQGAESLYAKAMREIVCNADTLTPETLQAVPTSLVQQIWRAIRREHQESVRIWKVFVNSGHGDRSFVHRARAIENAITKPIVDYFADMTSSSFARMTDLLLLDVLCSAADLKQLSILVSLRNLHLCHTIEDSGIVFDDKILNHWALCARDRGSFRFLEMIVVFRAPKITTDPFKCLNDFPALESLILYDTAVKRKQKELAKPHGWFIKPNGRFPSFVNARNLKSSYCDGPASRYGPVIDKLVQDYIDMRRLEDAKQSNLPVLTAELSPGRVRSPTGLHCNLDELLCFERDWTLSRDITKDRAASSISMEKQPPVSKKRKLKDGKALQLDRLLDGF